MIIKDRYAKEIGIADECIITKSNTLFKIKVYKITENTLQYLLYNISTDSYDKRNPIDWMVAYNQHQHNNIFKLC